MAASSESLAGLAGPAGVGAICFLAMFLFLDGRNGNLLPSVEAYAKMSTWSIVAALPTLALVYVLGVMTICLSQLLSQYLGPFIGIPPLPDPKDIVAIGIEKDSVRSQIFLKCYQEHEVLAGSGIALVLLSIGALSETRNLPELRNVIRLAAATVAIGGALAFLLSFSKASLAHSVATSASTSAPDASKAKSQALPLPQGGPKPSSTPVP
jgi:hypothetical protein